METQSRCAHELARAFFILFFFILDTIIVLNLALMFIYISQMIRHVGRQGISHSLDNTQLKRTGDCVPLMNAK